MKNKRELLIILAILAAIAVSHSPSVRAESLSELHDGCNDISKSRSPDCVAAMHRYCSKPGRGGAGVSQELGQGVFGVACFDPTSYGDVPLTDLTQRHGGCVDGYSSQNAYCMSAVRRWCIQTGHGNAGIAQELGPGVFGVACFNPQTYQDVALSTLKNEHGGCDDLSKSQNSDCVAAMHRWCNKSGHGTAGLAQEVGAGVFGVACFNTSWYGDVRIKPAGPGEPLTIVTANAKGSDTFGGAQWETRFDRLANLIANSGTKPDIISMTEFEGWRWCAPAWGAGDYDIVDRLIWRLKALTGVTYRIAYLAGVRGAFGPLGRCQYYSGDMVLYNPARLVNRTPEDATRFPQHAHDEEFIGVQMRRSLPLCNRGTNRMPLDQLIDGPPQTDKCGRPTPSGPAWAVVMKGTNPQGEPYIRVGGSLARFAFARDTSLSFDVFTVHPPAHADSNEAGPIVEFINAMSMGPYRTTPRYYPPLVVGDFNILVQPDPGQTEWPGYPRSSFWKAM